MVFANPISIITGGPGTGKTTVLKIILYIYQKKCGNEVKLMAPTGRAARRMAESTGSGDATTMHMALGLFGDGDYEALIDELSADFINVDEVSMVDMHLAYEFFYKVKAGARVLLVGDVHQLPSVGAGDVFRQLILCGKIPVTVLNLVYRQGKDSNIPINAQLINEGKTNLQWGDDFQMVECSGADAAAQIVKNIYLKEIQMYGMEQVQILSPYKVRSAAGVLELNRSLQDEVNPPVSGKRELHLGGEIFREGDRILQNKNTEFASNGDLGTLVQIAEDEDNNPLVQIVFTDGRRVKYEAEQVEMIEHANAITIHKSQGSECQVVIIPWLKAFYPMLKRNIFYTGITRAKQRVYIVGEWKAVCQAIHTDDTGTRKTMLAVKIQQYCERYYMGNDQLLPAYNVQIGVADEYIAVVDVNHYRSDMDCFIPLMKHFKQTYGFYPKYPVADAGYGSYNNYIFCEQNGMEKYMKFPMFKKETKEQKYHEDPFRAVNFRIDEQGVMRCPNDKAFHLLYRRSVRGNQYGRKEELYECEDCSGCPYAEKCKKTAKNRTVRINQELTAMHQEVIENLESIHGALLRMNRSIQAEGTFGIMKNDRWYKRIVRRGINSVKLEVLLVAIGHNLYKYQNKKMRNRTAA